MKEELNNTGILLADLTETEIKLAIELYKLAGFEIDDDAIIRIEEDDCIGVKHNRIGYWFEFITVTIHQLAFESGLNPDWAETILNQKGELYFAGSGLMQKVSSNSEEIKIPFLDQICETLTPVITKEKQNENWSEQDERRQENVMQNGNEGLHYNEMSNTEMARDLSTKDAVKNPSHYRFFEGVEVIEIIAKSMTLEQFKGYCLGNRLKYRLRAGNKDKLEQDIAKSDFYLELYEKHKHLCEA